MYIYIYTCIEHERKEYAPYNDPITHPIIPFPCTKSCLDSDIINFN